MGITQENIVRWLKQDERRDLYLSADYFWCMSYPPIELHFKTIPRSIVENLIDQNIVVDKYPGTKAERKCYRLKENE